MYFFGDGFDLYSIPADALIGGHWDTTSNPTNMGIVDGRFAASKAIRPDFSGGFYKTSGQNDSVHHFVCAINYAFTLTGGSGGFYVVLQDGTTSQCSIIFRSDGAIYFTSGGSGGTSLATYLGAVTQSNIWNAFEFEVVVHNTNGSIAIRRNGNPANDFFLGSLNTRVSANNYANKIYFGKVSGTGTYYVDDFIWRSDPTAVPWMGDLRCYTRVPVTDEVAQFSRSSSTTSHALYGSSINGSHPANSVRYIYFMATHTGWITGMSVAAGSGASTGHAKVALFGVATGGGVGNLLATSAEVTNPNPGTGSPIIFTFPTPVRVVAGQFYWAGINQDATINYGVINNPITNIALTQTYATWPVSNPGGTPASNNVPSYWTIIYTPQLNCEAVSELLPDALSSYVSSSINGQADLYKISAIPAMPFATIGIVTRGIFAKSDAGTRNAAMQIKSGATTVESTNTPLNTTWTWHSRVDLVDPATGVAWTPTGVNDVQIGPVVKA